MDAQIVELYTDADMERMDRRVRRWRIGLGALAAAALAVCVTLAATADTLTAQRMELAAVAVSTLAGWIVLYGAMFVVSPVRREMAHAAMLRREERQRFPGEIAVTGQRVAIRRSVVTRRVEVTGEEGVSRLLVSESQAAALAAARPIALYACHGYVAAYEVDA